MGPRHRWLFGEHQLLHLRALVSGQTSHVGTRRHGLACDPNVRKTGNEWKDGLNLDRLSCSSFWANQMRLLMVAAAYVLMQELCLRLKSTPLVRAQIETLRLQLLKIGGQVKRSVRRIVIHLAANHPWRGRWYKAARALGAAIP